MEFLHQLGGSTVLFHLKPEGTQLQLSLEPEPFILGISETLQGGAIECLKQLHVCAVRYEIQQAVYFLLALIPCDCTLDVLQHFPS